MGWRFLFCANFTLFPDLLIFQILLGPGLYLQAKKKVNIAKGRSDPRVGGFCIFLSREGGIEFNSVTLLIAMTKLIVVKLLTIRQLSLSYNQHFLHHQLQHWEAREQLLGRQSTFSSVRVTHIKSTKRE